MRFFRVRGVGVKHEVGRCNAGNGSERFLARYYLLKCQDLLYSPRVCEPW